MNTLELIQRDNNGLTDYTVYGAYDGASIGFYSANRGRALQEYEYWLSLMRQAGEYSATVRRIITPPQDDQGSITNQP
jgi:hypothetical protein